MLLETGGRLCGTGALLLALGHVSLPLSPLAGLLLMASGTVLFLSGARKVASAYSTPGIFSSTLYGYVLLLLSAAAGVYAFAVSGPLALLLMAAFLVIMWYVLGEAQYLMSTLKLSEALREHAEYALHLLFGLLLLPMLYLVLLVVLPRGVNNLLVILLALALAYSPVLVSMLVLRSLLGRLLLLGSVFTAVLVVLLPLLGIPLEYGLISTLLAVLTSLTLPLAAAFYLGRAFEALREKSGRKAFEVAGWVLAGSAITPVLTGLLGVLLLMPIAWLVVALAFFSASK